MSVPDGLEAAAGAAVALGQSQGETVVVVRRDGRVLGVISVSTPLRPEAGCPRWSTWETRAHHHDPEWRQRPGSGAHVAAQLGVVNARSTLSPADKLAALAAISNPEETRVLMVGDGVNDAPAWQPPTWDVPSAVGRKRRCGEQ